MKVAAAVTLLFATLAVANPMGEVLEKLENRQDCEGNLNTCNKRASAAVGRQCCSGLFCCGVVGPNNVCQTENTCGEPA